MSRPREPSIFIKLIEIGKHVPGGNRAVGALHVVPPLPSWKIPGESRHLTLVDGLGEIDLDTIEQHQSRIGNTGRVGVQLFDQMKQREAEIVPRRDRFVVDHLFTHRLVRDFDRGGFRTVIGREGVDQNVGI